MKKIILNGNTGFSLFNFRNNLMKELEKKGYQIICIANEDSSAQKIKNNNWKFINSNMDRRGKNIFNDLKLLIFYLKTFKREKPQYILNYTIKPNIYGTIAARILKIPTINNITGLGDTFSNNNIVNKIVKILYKISFRYPKKVFFQNEDDQKIFLENNLVKKNICDCIPGSGVQLDKFVPMNKIRKDNDMVFLYLGRIAENKGLRIINEISKKIYLKYPNIKFQLLGKIYKDESESIPLEELKSWEKGSNIQYLGTSSDVREQIREADFIIYPSYYREGVPRALIEAAAMGKVILTTDNVGCRDIVKDGYNGYLAKLNDVDSMLNIVEKAIHLNEKEKKKFEENSRKKAVEEFDEKIVINKYLEIINQKEDI